MDHAESVGLM